MNTMNRVYPSNPLRSNSGHDKSGVRVYLRPHKAGRANEEADEVATRPSITSATFGTFLNMLFTSFTFLTRKTLGPSVHRNELFYTK